MKNTMTKTIQQAWKDWQDDNPAEAKALINSLVTSIIFNADRGFQKLVDAVCLKTGYPKDAVNQAVQTWR